MKQNDQIFIDLQGRYNAGESDVILLSAIRSFSPLQQLGIPQSIDKIMEFLDRDDHEHIHGRLSARFDGDIPSPLARMRNHQAELRDLQRTRTGPAQESLRRILLSLTDTGVDTNGSVISPRFFEETQREVADRNARIAAYKERMNNIATEAKAAFTHEIVSSFLRDTSSATFWHPLSRGAANALMQLKGGSEIANLASAVTSELLQVAGVVKLGRSFDESVAVALRCRPPIAPTLAPPTLVNI